MSSKNEYSGLEISNEELKKIPYLVNIPIDGRSILMPTFYSEEISGFEIFVPNNEGKLLKLPAKLEQGTYWSKRIVDTEIDVYIKLCHLLTNNYSFPNICHILIGIEHDIQNFGAIIHKQIIIFDYYRKNQSSSSTSISGILETEIEYLMGIIRSYFDLLNGILRCLFKRNNLPELPESLGSIADMEFDDVIKKYTLNLSIIEYLKEILPLFKICRRMRDDIYHKGKDTSIVFITDKGPGICIEYSPFSNFKEFLANDEIFQGNLLPKNIGSLFYFLNKIIRFVLKSTEMLAEKIEETFTTPPGIFNDGKLWLRGPGIKYLNQIDENLKKCWLVSGENDKL